MTTDWKPLTEDQEYCKRTLAEWADGEHHLPDVKAHGFGICINWLGDLSTYDFNGLTRLVLLAHRDGVRFGIRSSGPGMVKITAHRRKTGPRGDLSMSQWHPSITHLLSDVRQLAGIPASPEEVKEK